MRKTPPLLSRSDFRRGAAWRLRQLISKLGLSQAEAAEAMGVSRQVLANWLAGDNAIGTYALYRLCRLKGVNDYNYVFLGDWSRLPHDLAQEFEREVTAKVAAKMDRPATPARRVREKNDA